MDIDNEAGAVNILADGQNRTAVSASYFTGTAVHLVTIVCVVSPDATQKLEQNGTVLLQDVLQIGSSVDPVRISSLTSNGDDVSLQQNTAEVCSYCSCSFSCYTSHFMIPCFAATFSCVVHSTWHSCEVSFVQIIDHRGGGETSLQLQVELPKPLSLTATATMQEVLQSEPLTGLPVSIELHTTILYSHMHQYENFGAPEGSRSASAVNFQCTASPSSAVQSIIVEERTAHQGRCIFILAAALNEDVSDIVLTASISGHRNLTTHVPVKVWQIRSVAVTESSSFRHPIPAIRPVSGSPECNGTSNLCDTSVTSSQIGVYLLLLSFCMRQESDTAMICAGSRRCLYRQVQRSPVESRS